MSYKKYIEKNGKVYGPYIYHSRRVNGKVISEYHGPKPQTSSRKIFLPIIAAVFGISVFLFLFFTQGNLTGQATLDLTGNYNSNEPLSGILNFNLQQGELIPVDSKIIFEQDNTKYEYILSDLAIQESVEGNFYIQNSDLTDQGEGYGLVGLTKNYQTVYFKLKLTTEEETGNSEETTGGSEETTDILNDTEVAPDQVDLEEEVPSIEDTENEEPTNEIENPIEEQPTSEEIIVETSAQEETAPEPEATQTETPSETTKETSSEPTPEPSTTESTTTETSTITGNIIKGIVGTVSNFFLGLGPTGQVSLDLEEEIQGDVISGKPFEYNLKNKQTAEIIEGSVRTDLKELPNNVLTLSQEENKLIITTDYSEGESGFGEEYLGEEKTTLLVNISDLNLMFNPGKIKVSIVSQDKEIISLETTLEENVSIETKPEENEIIVNETNQTIELNQTNETITNQTIIIQEIQNLTTEEIETLKENLPPMNGIKRTAKEYKEWIVVNFVLGDYNAEFTYDKELPKETLEYLIEKDRINWLKDLANQFSEEKTESIPLENLTQTYII